MSAETFPYLEENQRYLFPDPQETGEGGIVAWGGNLSPGMLLSAYSQGIFPWFSGDEPILWWCPDPRFVLFPEKLHVPSRFRRSMRNSGFTVRSDTCFRQVIENCSAVKRRHEDGTWITSDMIEAYCRLHELGWAHSVEVFAGDRLAGGLYGVSLGRVFFGESMFSLESGASRTGFIQMAKRLGDEGFLMIDCQIHSEYLAGMGAENIPRGKFLGLLKKGLAMPSEKGPWRLFQ